ncbi:MAG: colicin immunity domain-containing protein [Chloroflexota bacterium]|nr:colicin immunity domain-containing protein [Chloroflexota bacterium]
MEKVVDFRSPMPDLEQKVEPYLRLMERFATRALPVHDFERAYLETFDDDGARWPEPIYRILNEVFLDVDAFNPYPDGRNELDIDEAELRVRVERSLAALRRAV